MLTCQRSLFALPQGSHYLNCAYMSPLSKRVVEVGRRAVERKAVPFTILSGDFFSHTERLRSLFAQLVNAEDATRVAIVPSVSYGLAQAARNTPVHRGQKIVTVSQQFPSNVYVWQRIARQSGARVDVVFPPIKNSGRAAAWNEALLEAIDSETAVVALGHVHWADGTLFDLKAVRARTRDVGAALIVDGTQSVGAMPFNVKEISPDVLVCAGYKWLLGPYALSLAYFGPRYDEGEPLEETWMGRLGSEDFSGLVLYEERYRRGAARYDMGQASNFILVPMLITALEQLLEWGAANIERYGRALALPLLDKLRERGFWVAEDEWRGGHLFGIRLEPHVDLATLRQRLQERQVYVSVRGDAVRVSVHVYNDAGDIDALGQVLLD